MAPARAPGKRGKAPAKHPINVNLKTVRDYCDSFSIAADARERPDCLLTAKERFDAYQDDLRDVIDLVAALTGRKMKFTPVNLSDDAVWDAEGLRDPFTLVLGHFETLSLGLDGVLRALQNRSDGVVRLKSRVWGLLNTALGPAAFSRMVVANIVPFSGHHDAGKEMWLGFPPFAEALVNRLFLCALNCLGPPEKVAGFGLPVRPPTATGRVRMPGDGGARLRLIRP